MNRGHGRRQIDMNKVLVKVENGDDFFTKDMEEKEDTLLGQASSTSGDLKKKGTMGEGAAAPAPKKTEIVIPVAKQEDPLRDHPEYFDIIYKKRKMQNHYVRIDYIHPLPPSGIYEVTDRDMLFIKEINEKLPKPPKGSTAQELTMQGFGKTIETWENATDKGDIIPLAKAASLVESQFPENQKEIITKIYEYWKGLREEFMRPLIRKYLKVTNKDDNNPNAAFRFREASKMKTRRTQRTSDADHLEKMRNIRKDLDNVITIMGNVKYREMVKLEFTELSNFKYECSIRDKSDISAMNKVAEKIKEKYENEKWLKVKNRFKEYNVAAKKIIDRYLEESKVEMPVISLPSTPVVKYQPKPEEELKFDLGCFIASVLDESLENRITADYIADMLREEVPEELSIKKIPSIHPQHQPQPQSQPMLQPVDLFRSVSIPQHQPQVIHSHSSMVQKQAPEDKIERFLLQKRIGRQKRVYFDRIFEEDEFSYSSHPREFYHNQPHKNEPPLSQEFLQKLRNNNLYDLYIARFGKLREICPFNDSEEEGENAESTKMMKNLANNFKMFQKQRRPSGSLV